MFSTILPETSAGLFRLPGRWKWKDTLGKRSEVLTRSHEEEAGEEEDSEFWQQLGDLDSRGIDSYSTVPLQFRLKGKYDSFEALSHEAGQPSCCVQAPQLTNLNKQEMLLAAEILTRILSLLPAVKTLTSLQNVLGLFLCHHRLAA